MTAKLRIYATVSEFPTFKARLTVEACCRGRAATLSSGQQAVLLTPTDHLMLVLQGKGSNPIKQDTMKGKLRLIGVI